MIAFLLWAILLVVFWPIALAIGLAWCLFMLVRLCLGLGMLSLKAVVGTGMVVGAGAKAAHDYRQQGQPRLANGIRQAGRCGRNGGREWYDPQQS